MIMSIKCFIINALEWTFTFVDQQQNPRKRVFDEY